MTKRDRTADFCSQLNKIDVSMRAVYGMSLQEYRKWFIGRAYEEGYREGRAAGRRAAKGLEEDTKKRGRPPVIDGGFMTLLMDHVDARRQEMTIDEAIQNALDTVRAGSRALSADIEKIEGRKAARAFLAHENSRLPTHEQAKRAYFRLKRNAQGKAELLNSGDLFSK